MQETMKTNQTLIAWSLGDVEYDGKAHPYTTGLKSGDTVEIVLDMELPSLRFKINGLDKGVAFNGDQLKQGPYFLTVLMSGYGSGNAVTILKSVHEVNNWRSDYYNI